MPPKEYLNIPLELVLEAHTHGHDLTLSKTGNQFVPICYFRTFRLVSDHLILSSSWAIRSLTSWNQRLCCVSKHTPSSIRA